MQAANIGPVAPHERTQSPFDLFLIFAGANIVATTLQAGAALTPAFGWRTALALIGTGAVLGSALVASLAPLGPRLGVPSIIAARAALGRRGAALVALLLYFTNFAWIAVNNVIAASAAAQVVGGPISERLWAVGLGVLATAVVAGGPSLVGRADRVAVPLLFLTGVGYTMACLRLPAGVVHGPGSRSAAWIQGLDIVIAYQVSWILMFADYSRYTRSAARGALAVFLGLALTTLWFMPLGFLSARAAGSREPGAMLAAVGLGPAGAVLLTLGTLTTNFVNIYLSSLALKSLVPKAEERVSVWSTGLVGAALGLLSTAWLDQYTTFMLVLGAVLVPVGGVLLAHFFLLRRPTDVAGLYAHGGSCDRCGGFAPAGLTAWALGAVTYALAAPVGGTLPALGVAIVVYLIGSTFSTPPVTLGAEPRREQEHGGAS